MKRLDDFPVDNPAIGAGLTALHDHQKMSTAFYDRPIFPRCQCEIAGSLGKTKVTTHLKFFKVVFNLRFLAAHRGFVVRADFIQTTDHLAGVAD